jgi:hypothetical protein
MEQHYVCALAQGFVGKAERLFAVLVRSARIAFLLYGSDAQGHTCGS